MIAAVLVAGAAGTALSLPGQSSAAVVSVSEAPAPVPLSGLREASEKIYVLELRDPDGHPNALTVEIAGGHARVHDARARVHAGAGCRQAGPYAATCVKPNFFRAELETGRGDDSLSVTSDAFVRALLGPGDDLFDALDVSEGLGVDAGTGDDVVNGSQHGDMLLGHRGHDVLRGRGGDDELIQGDTTRRHGRDVLQGGPGIDRVDYERRTAGVRVDLARTNGQGERGENDAISGVEEIIGGDGRDVLKGDGENNFLDARGGRGDVVIGRAGKDYIWHAGRVFAGPGQDIVIEGERSARVSCGRGFDDVTQMSHRGRNVFDPDCERIGLAGEDENYRSLVPLKSPSATVGRFSGGCGESCDVTLTLVALSAAGAPGETIGRSHATVPGETTRTIELRLSRRGRALFRARRHLRALVKVRVAEPKSRFGPRRVRRDGFETALK